MNNVSSIKTPDDLITPYVELIGQDGNAMSIMGACSRALRKEGNSQETVDAFMKEAMSGDYNHVLNTAMAYCEVG